MISEDNFEDQILQIEEEPFPTLYARLAPLESRLEEIENFDDIGAVREQLRDVFREGTVAYVQRETRLVQEHMQDKGIKIFSASATSFLEWKNPIRDKDPYLDPETSGIPAIMRFFLGVPASTNLKNYNDHVTKVLPAWRKRAKRVLGKHTEDKVYANLRQDVAQQIPLLRGLLEETLATQLHEVIAIPWTEIEKLEIVEGIKKLFEKKWKDPDIPYNSWAKMLRENGIPINGVFLGHNLNEDVSGPVSQPLEDWTQRMTEIAEALGRSLNQPIQILLAAIQLQIHTCTAVPELMDATAEALQDVASSIESAHETLSTDLDNSLIENHLRFTTEMDVECPIAQAMKPSYKRALDPAFVKSGKGIYKRQKTTLQDSMLNPKRHAVRLKPDERIEPLVDTLKVQIMSCQRDLWKKDCTAFITRVIEELEGFSQTMEELLMDAEFMNPEHQEARAKLENLLVYFDESLIEVQNNFKDLVEEPPAKKVKVEEAEEPGPFVATEGPETFGEEESVPITPDLGWHHFLATMHPLTPQ